MSGSRIDLARVKRALEARPSAPSPPEEGDARAAVAAVLREGPLGAEVLLIRRAARDGDPWSGHMAFPGGRQQPSDPDLLHTAMRETLEEVGLDLSTSGTLIGGLDEVRAIARGRRMPLTIAPYVFSVSGEPALVTNTEVEEVLWAPLDALAADELATIMAYEMDGNRFELPAWDLKGRIVWGLTYRMLQELFEVVRAC